MMNVLDVSMFEYFGHAICVWTNVVCVMYVYDMNYVPRDKAVVWIDQGYDVNPNFWLYCKSIYGSK